MTPLFAASIHGHTDVVALLLARKEIDVNQADEHFGANPLLIACGQGHVKIVKLLLARTEIDVNQPEKEGGTPLLAACQSKQGHDQIVTLLLSFKHLEVDVNQPMTSGKSNGATPLVVSSYLGRFTCVERLLQHPDIDTTLQFQQHSALHWSQPGARHGAWESSMDEQIDEEGRKKVVHLLKDAGGAQ